MMVPEVVVAGSWLADAVREALRVRPVWSLVREGEHVTTRLSAAERDRVAARVFASSSVFALRRHERVHGPIAGFVVSPALRRARLSELLVLDEDPWHDGALRAGTREGLEALVLRFRASHPGIDTITMPELG